MNSLREKVTEKLSRIFTDSSPSGSSSSSIHSPTNPSEAKSYTRGGKSLSSYFSNISFDGFKSNKRRQDIRPTQSFQARWRTKDFEHQGEPLDSCTDCRPTYESIPDALEEEEEAEHGSGRSTSGSDMSEDSISATKSDKAMPKNLKGDSTFISSEIYAFLQSSLPNIVKGCQWVLLYSTLKHGISLRTLLRKSADASGPCLLIAGDMQGSVFGGLLECPLKPTAKRKYQGTNQTFIFTTIYGEPRVFRPTGANRYFYMCLNDLLGLGGGGNFALRLNEDLLSGTSGPSETFGNLCLAHTSEFEVKNVELWGFTHSLQYLA